VKVLTLGGRQRVVEGGGHVAYDNAVTTESEAPEVLLIVATLGRRPEYLRQTLESIRSQSIRSDIVMVAPLDAPGLAETAAEFDAQLVQDPGSLPKAINLGAQEGLKGHKYLNWLNDDDLLEPGSLEATKTALEADPAASVAFGACQYIDGQGRPLWVSKAGSWAPRVLSWGPDLIPQPGMLMRVEAWHRVGGLDTSYSLAFDLDLLLKLKKVGPLVNTGTVVSSFRWHADSLTVDDRTTNLVESERAKRASLGPVAVRLAWIWEPPVRFAIRRAANAVQRRARKMSSL
jgi:GT2 family glycosyltransferase